MKLNYKHTILACYLGYITQAMVVNFPPLLFLTFQRSYGLSLNQISLIIAVSFATQLLTDLIFAKIGHKLHQRTALVLSQGFVVGGFLTLALLTSMDGFSYGAILFSSVLCGIGGGMVEVLVSPLLEACPIDEKSGAMSLLHSFYCWGQAGVVLLSTLFFTLVGIEHWKMLTMLWALIPLIGAVAFSFVPVYQLPQNPDASSQGARALFGNGIFRLLFLMMLCAGASEMVMSQWASSFAENGLGVNKAMGDLLGPCLFALLMGTSRVLYAAFSQRIALDRFMTASAVLCVGAYLTTSLVPNPLIALVGCALCGLSCGIMWPGTLSMAARKLPYGGVSMFAILALAGDIGCLSGPTIAGAVADMAGGEIRYGFLFALVFPVVLIGVIARLHFKTKKKDVSSHETL